MNWTTGEISMNLLLKFWIILGMFIPALGITSETPSELSCLTANIFSESRGETTKGMRAIADVTLNRVQHKAFPKTVCAVVLQPMQFSWVKGDAKRARKLLNKDLRGLKDKDLAAYQKAQSIAVEALSEGYKPLLPRSIVSFHNNSVNPNWSTTMKKYAKIGSHTFYSFKRKGSK